MKMARIKEALEDMNPWWKGEYKAEFNEREIYRQMQKFMPMPQIIALTGLRRVGKTTIMLKMAEDALKMGFEPTKIVYFSFDEFRETEIREIMKEYGEMTGNDIREGKYIIMLDEIQKLDDWGDKLKSFYDAYRKNLKIIISGSESLFIRKKSRETLAGRIFEFKIETLTFKEFLVFKKIDFKPLPLYKKELNKLLNEYILTEGFPELVNIGDKSIIKKYIKESIIEKILYKDLPAIFKIRDISLLEQLLNLFIEEPGQLVEISGLAKDLKISRQTLSNYLMYLEKSYLVRKLYNFSRSKKKSERKLKKYYPSVISTELLFKDDILSKSKVFEWIIVSQARAEFFWRDPYKNEVDMIMTKDEIMPAEVKYGKIDFKGILAFMRKFKVSKGCVISYDAEETKKLDNKTISIVPAYKFLLE